MLARFVRVRPLQFAKQSFEEGVPKLELGNEKNVEKDEESRLGKSRYGGAAFVVRFVL
jgi:hypothetical protein